MSNLSLVFRNERRNKRKTASLFLDAFDLNLIMMPKTPNAANKKADRRKKWGCKQRFSRQLQPLISQIHDR